MEFFYEFCKLHVKLSQGRWGIQTIHTHARAKHERRENVKQFSRQDIVFISKKLGDTFECKYKVPLYNFNMKRPTGTYSILF